MLLYLNGIFVGLLILSNIVAVKLFSVGTWAMLPAAVIIYIFTFPITDVIVFGRLKDKHGSSKLWLRNNASTMLSQLIDTTIFITIAFIGTMPLAVLGGLVLTQYIFKFIASVVLTPVVYLLVNLVRRQESIAASNGQAVGE